MNDSVTIDDVGPMPLLRPGSAAELVDIVRRARREETALFAVGGGTMLDLGNPPARPGWAVDCRGLDAVVDYPARDMTITVGAGITIARLQQTLAREGQRLPIDVPRADQATLGGVLAANVSGPRRLGYGTLRDYVIGISAVNDEGEEFKAGGRVVKNVAGYDLCKLLIGSLGTLGIITQVTLKLRPLPESSRLVLLPAADERLAETLNRLHDSKTRPVAVELLEYEEGGVDFPGAGAAPTRGQAWLIVVGCEGNREAVDWQVRQLEDEWQGEARPVAEASTASAWQGLVEPAPHAVCVFKAGLLSSRVAEFCRAVRKAGGCSLRAHAGSGIVWGQARAGLTLKDAGAILSAWRQGATHVVVTRCPAAWKSTLNVWGPEPEGARLLREVKARFDPAGIFAPGRFVVG
jgi:glycolate oxidase FAD binding subunit